MYKVLVIEDDKIMGKILVRIFHSEMMEAKHCATGEEGFQTCLKELPDLVLMDINLPDGSGLDLCRKMKENPRVKHIPVVMLTGDAMTVENKVQGLESGAEDYILKPFIADELVARVRGVIKRSLNIGG